MAQLLSGSLKKCIGTVLWIGLLVTSAWATPSLTQVNLHADREQILVNGILEDAFTEKMMEALHSGVPLTFIYDIELLRNVSFYPDELISQNRIIHTVQYDTLKKTYEFTSMNVDAERKVVTKKPELGRELMMTLKDIPLASVYLLDPDEQYYVRVKAEMDNDDGLWFPFNWLLFFVPIDDFETSWVESSLIKVDATQGFPMEATQPEQSPSGPQSGGLNDAIRAFSQ